MILVKALGLLVLTAASLFAPSADNGGRNTTLYTVPYPDPVERKVTVEEPPPAEPEIHVHRIWAKVTACSPEDPQDLEYYREHGYRGATYNIAAYYGQFPRGTQIYVPGYMSSKGEKYWEVDSPGGSVIRRSHRSGITQIDVKFRTFHSAKEWGVKWMYIDVVYPDNR